ncbi:MAG: hypothetical protein LBS71_01585 [Puniceicoccales bacterium]|jgi:DNA polymerase III delta prime subunit|nr:hypothetical protein [Puniceicoccales bacterium]
MDFTSYVQQTITMISENRLPHAIIVETENSSDGQRYIFDCASYILKTTKPLVHPDFFSIEPGGKINVIKIESVRELIEYAQKTPHTAAKKVMTIFDAHRLNRNAANALLKTLEEPPIDTVLFLTTPLKNLLLPTIMSRCTLHHLPENPATILSPEFITWLKNLKLFLQKLSTNAQGINILEIFTLLGSLSKIIEDFDKNEHENEKNISIKEVQQWLLKDIIAMVWDIFHSISPAYFVHQLIKIISKSSLILVFNGSFTHVMESILLQFHQKACGLAYVS